MFFIADDNWEMDHSNFRVLGRRDAKRFLLVEASYSNDVFVIDVSSNASNGKSRWRRFFCASVQHSLQLINETTEEECRLSLLSNRDMNNGDYGIVDIIKIIEAKDGAGGRGYVYHCKNERLHFRHLAANSLDELTDIKTLYFASRLKKRN